MKTNRNWYVTYTKQGSERRVAELLSKKKITNYCPTCNHVKDYHGKSKISSVSLFSEMVFVYVSEEELTLVKNTDGVSGILFWLQKPALVSESEINSIRDFLQNHNDVQLEKNTVQVRSEVVSDSAYSFSKNDYNTFGIDGLKKLHLPSLGYALLASSTAQLKSVA